MSVVRAAAAVLLCVGLSQPALAERTSPEAPNRTNAQNYKDLVLASCLSQAFKSSPDAAGDTGSSASALVEWAYFDMEAGTVDRIELIKRYLARDYTHPLVEAKGVRFDTLKCLDLYHSEDLAKHMARFVIDPDKKASERR